MNTLKLKKSGRVVQELPWNSTTCPRPWKNGYKRVMIPLTAAESINSNKKCHIQIVRVDSMEVIRD